MPKTNDVKWPVTTLFLLGREVQAEYYAQELTRYSKHLWSTEWLAKDAQSALRAAVVYDF